MITEIERAPRAAQKQQSWAKTEEQIKAIVLDQVAEAEDYQAELADIGEEALKLYLGDDFLEAEEGYSKASTSDAFDVIESLAATIVRVFQSDPDMLELEPMGPEDQDNSLLIKEFIKYQDQKQNRVWVQFHDWIKTALMHPLAAMKQTWLVEEEAEEITVKGVSPLALLALAQEDKIEVLDVSEADAGLGTVDIKLKVITKRVSKPVFEALPPEEFIITPSKNLKEAKLAGHKQVKTLSELREMGFDDETIEDLVADVQAHLNDPVYVQRWGDILQSWTSDDGDDASREVVLYEVYTSIDLNEDGVVEPVKILIANETILEIEVNPFERPPFHIMGGAYRMPFRLHGLCVPEVVKQLQEVRTTLWRQVLNWLYINNLGRYVGDPDKINMADFLHNNRPGGFVRGEPEAIKALLPAPIDARFIAKMLEEVEQQREDRTGVTKYQQGNDAQHLNKTAHGISLIFQAAQQRVEQIIKIWAETGIRDFYEFRIALNAKFLDPETPVRVLGEWVTVNPEVFNADYDIIVNVNLGRADKQTHVGILSNILGLQLQMVGKVPFITPQNIYHTFTELIAATGERNVDAFVTPPEQWGQPQQPGMPTGGPPNGQLIHPGATGPGVQTVPAQPSVAQGQGGPAEPIPT